MTENRFSHAEVAGRHYVRDSLLDIYAPFPSAETAQRAASHLHFGVTVLGDYDWMTLTVTETDDEGEDG